MICHKERLRCGSDGDKNVVFIWSGRRADDTTKLKAVEVCFNYPFTKHIIIALLF